MRPMQISQNACSDQSTKCIGERAASIEPGDPMTQLPTLTMFTFIACLADKPLVGYTNSTCSVSLCEL